jgi:RHS repeat-associated protein
VTAVTTNTGAPTERYYYSPYGALTFLDGSFNVLSTQASQIGNEVTYTGRQLDAESGLYYFRNRYVHSQCGVFLSRDLLGYLDDNNLYRLLHNRPGIDRDPRGTMAIWVAEQSWPPQPSCGDVATIVWGFTIGNRAGEYKHCSGWVVGEVVWLCNVTPCGASPLTITLHLWEAVHLDKDEQGDRDRNEQPVQRTSVGLISSVTETRFFWDNVSGDLEKEWGVHTGGWGPEWCHVTPSAISTNDPNKVKDFWGRYADGPRLATHRTNWQCCCAPGTAHTQADPQIDR